MANNIGTLLTAPARPASTADTFPSAYADELLGGHHQADTLAERDAIPLERRKIGMLCTVAETGKTYRLEGTLENSGWTDILEETHLRVSDAESAITTLGTATSAAAESITTLEGRADQADGLLETADQRASALEGQITSLSSQVQGLEVGDDLRVPNVADLPATLNSSGATKFAEVYSDNISSDNNGRYFQPDGSSSWSKVAGDVKGRVAVVEVKTSNITVEDALFVRGRESLEVSRDVNGNIATALAKDGTLAVARLDAAALANPTEVANMMGLQQYPTVAAGAANVAIDDDIWINGKKVLEAWRDSGGRIGKALLEDGEVYINKLRIAQILDAEAFKAGLNIPTPDELKVILGIGILPATVAQIAQVKYNAGNPLTPWEALAMAAYRKIDVVMVGDSNQLHSAEGWDAAWGKAFGARWKMHSSPLYFTQRTSVGYSTSGQGMGPEIDPVPAPYTQYFIKCAQLADGATDTNGAGIIVNADSKLDVNSALRWECLYGTSDTGAGSFRPGWRRESTPFSPGAWGTTVNVNTGVVGVARATYDLPASTRNYAIKMGGQIQGSTTPTGSAIGPVTIFCERIIDTLATTGFSATTWMAESGKSLEDMLGYAQAYDRSAAIAFFTEIRRVQAAGTGRPIFVFIINSGLNDRNNSGPSKGWRKVADGDGPEAYVDNLEGLLDFVETVWESQGWDVAELYWILIPSQRISDPDDAELVSYRQATRSAMSKRQRCAVVDIGQIMTYAEGITNGWYQSDGTDPIHLTPVGHQALAERILVNQKL